MSPELDRPFRFRLGAPECQLQLSLSGVHNGASNGALPGPESLSLREVLIGPVENTASEGSVISAGSS